MQKRDLSKVVIMENVPSDKATFHELGVAESGSAQHQIMAVMAHMQARTSEIYTKGVERRVLASDGITALSTLNW